MVDFLSELRNHLLSERPSLKKFMPRGKLSGSRCKIEHPNPSSLPKVPKPKVRQKEMMCEEFVRVNPDLINGETGVYSNRGTKYKKVSYGSTPGFLVHRTLNPPHSMSKNLCPNEQENLEKKKEYTLNARQAKAEIAAAQKNLLSEESELRRESLKNTANQKTGPITSYERENRIRNKLIVRNAGKALVDKQEEMLEFYRSVGSKQVLAMRELQIQDNEHFKEIGLTSREIFMNQTIDQSGPSEYEEMVTHRKDLHTKNKKIVDVLKKQAIEKEILCDLIKEENMENAERLDALVEIEMARELKLNEMAEKEKHEHFKINDQITSYRDYVRQVRVAEDRALLGREEEFLRGKEQFNKAFAEKRDRIIKEKQFFLNRLGEDLTSALERQQQEEMEYYYTLEKEKDLEQQDMEIQEKLDKKVASQSLMKDWQKISEENRLIKEEEKKRMIEEKARNDRFLEEENKIKAAEQRRRLVEKDITRMELMYQMNERQSKRAADLEAKAYEAKLLKAEGFVRDGAIRERMLERMEDFKNSGLPERFLVGVKQHYSL